MKPFILILMFYLFFGQTHAQDDNNSKDRLFEQLSLDLEQTKNFSDSFQIYVTAGDEIIKSFPQQDSTVNNYYKLALDLSKRNKRPKPFTC